MPLNDQRIPVTFCRKCGYRMDSSTAAHGDHRPRAGDVSMCLGCGDLTIFNDDLTLREPNEKESIEIRLAPEVIEAQLVRSSVVGDAIKNRRANERKNQA